MIKESLSGLIDSVVVLDTDGAIVYLGRLVDVSDDGFWLADADLHDCRDGHATKEEYVAEAHVSGYAPNRRRVFVLRSAVMSVTALDEVIAGHESPDDD